MDQIERTRVQRYGQWLRRVWRSHWGTVVLVLVTFFGVQAWQTRHVPSRLALDGFTAVVIDPTGAQRTQSVDQVLDQLRREWPGQPVALHVWADWCPICQAEEGSVGALTQDWPVLTVAMQSGASGKVSAVLRQRQLRWLTVVDERAELSRALGVRSVPAFAVIDTQGRVRAPTVGYTSEWGMRLRLWWVRLTPFW